MNAVNSQLRDRIQLDVATASRSFGQFRLRRDGDGHCLEGRQPTHDGVMCFELRLRIPPDYPFGSPDLLVLAPQPIRRYGGQGTLNELGLSHDFHMREPGPGGCVRICYASSWDPSMTLLLVLVRGVIWCEGAYAHQRTGITIDEFLRRLGRLM